MHFPKLSLILYQCHKEFHRKHTMGIKQYLLIYLREWVLQFYIRKDFYMPANICAVSVNGHNFLMIQSYENYNSFMILPHFYWFTHTRFWSMISSNITVPNRTGLLSVQITNGNKCSPAFCVTSLLTEIWVVLVTENWVSRFFYDFFNVLFLVL